MYHSMAKLAKIVEKSKREQFVVIVDLAGLSYWQVAHYDGEQYLVYARDSIMHKIFYDLIIFCSCTNDVTSFAGV